MFVILKMGPKETVNFLLEVGKLKKVRRTGWILKGVKNPESVAEHSFRVAMMAMILPEGRKLDQFRLLKMALIHDLAESITSDIVWEHGKLSDMEKLKVKQKRELEVGKELFSLTKQSKGLYELLDDYLKQGSPEAKFLKELDKLEMGVQALEYDSTAEHSLEEFWENIEKYLKDQELTQIFEQLKSRRDQP